MKTWLLYPDESRDILRAFYHVYNDLGFGFLEKVYENALAISLRKLGREVIQQGHLKVYFEEETVGDYFADLIVDNAVIVEIKAQESLHPAHEAQLLNYLRATELELGFLLNFGEVPQFKRKIYSNERKGF